MMKPIIYITFLVLFLACTSKSTDKPILVEQVRNTELSFSKYAQEAGVQKAFIAFADDSAVLVRNNQVIKGKEEIAEFLGANSLSGMTLSWKPDFIEVSDAGDLAYTYGQYRLTRTDSSGNEQSNTGIFHTVWKRQEDGSWKFVYD